MAPAGYTAVTVTGKELAAWRTKNPNRPQPSTRRLQCNFCDKRIWGSGLGVGAHNRSKACAAVQAVPVAQSVVWDKVASPTKAAVHRAYRRNDTIECRCGEHGRDHVARLEIYGALSN